MGWRPMPYMPYGAQVGVGWGMGASGAMSGSHKGGRSYPGGFDDGTTHVVVRNSKGKDEAAACPVGNVLVCLQASGVMMRGCVGAKSRVMYLLRVLALLFITPGNAAEGWLQVGSLICFSSSMSCFCWACLHYCALPWAKAFEARLQGSS